MFIYFIYMKNLAHLIKLANYFSFYTHDGWSGIFIGATEYALKFDLDITDKIHNIHKYYFYFKSSSLRFPISIRNASFIPPKWSFLDLYMILSKYLSAEIELISLDDEVFEYWINCSPSYWWYVFWWVEWLTEYYSNELTNTTTREKDRYNPGGSAYRLRKIYNDIMNSASSDRFRAVYIKQIQSLHKNVSCLSAVRIWDQILHGEMDIIWVTSRDNFVFHPNQALTTMHTNMRYMEQIIQSKVLIVESKSRLSHAAVIAQELNIPCFLWIKDIYMQLFHWDQISIEAHSSDIKIIKRFYEIPG